MSRRQGRSGGSSRDFSGNRVRNRGPHKTARPFGILTLNLWIGEAIEMVHALTIPCEAWFLDGHGPKKNPDMWRRELLMSIGEKTVTGGTCATFTVAGAVRRALIDAGFSIEQHPGFGGKKAVLKGLKR